ncbi:MAG: tRNA epoxyqueuosine(34) reductase QueG [Epulopiscium sp.]|nr:tRNA epoxyqueuosine(34) reductase QueG [Candidatus Epulonipiscium sp.]
MKNNLKRFCLSIGIECVGIASSGPYYDLKKILEKRVEVGYNTEFENKELQKRICPSLTLEGAKSVIVCLFPYYVGNREDANISKYTYGLDYHKIVEGKLKQIGIFLDNIIENFEYKAYVDSGPLVDRYLAYKAGLGFYGVNSHLITDKYGSYVFIGYIINNYPFKPDEPMEKTCIQCRRCIKACPGSAIPGDFTINPFKCRSYISQKKVELSERDKEILKKDKLLFGCDICQDVCPHNKSISMTNMDEFKDNLLTFLSYDEISNISNKEFMRRYKDRAFSWRGKKTILRNFEIIDRNPH